PLPSGSVSRRRRGRAAPRSPLEGGRRHTLTPPGARSGGQEPQVPGDHGVPHEQRRERAHEQVTPERDEPAAAEEPHGHAAQGAKSPSYQALTGSPRSSDARAPTSR